VRVGLWFGAGVCSIAFQDQLYDKKKLAERGLPSAPCGAH
jgi:hypothetical protein